MTRYLGSDIKGLAFKSQTFHGVMTLQVTFFNFHFPTLKAQGINGTLFSGKLGIPKELMPVGSLDHYMPSGKSLSAFMFNDNNAPVVVTAAS